MITTAQTIQPARSVRMRFHDASIPLDRLSLRDAAPDDPATDVVCQLTANHFAVRIEGADIVAGWSGSPEADLQGDSRWPVAHFSAEKAGDVWTIRQRTADPGPARGPTPPGGPMPVVDAATRAKLRDGNDRLRAVLVAHNAGARERWGRS